jgi:hypothetical protein
MSDEPFALATVPLAPPASGDYDAICATVMESARGRWFLDEFARRNRNADTSLVLNAIERIERVIRGDRDQQAYQGFRMELLEMAKTIAVTRAEVAEIAPEPERAQAAAPAAPASDAFATAERIQEVAWTMRERGLEPSTCDQIEALATSILSASALRDPNDRRAHKLAEVLQQLERRINAMLDSCAENAAAAMAEVEAQSEAGPSASRAEPHAAASALPVHDIEAESLPVAEPEPTAAAAPVAADEDPAPEFAIALATELVDPVAVTSPAAEPEPQPAPQSASAEPQIEVAELELEPLVVVPAGQSMAAEDAPEATFAGDVAQPPAELELAPLIPTPIERPPLDHETPSELGLEPIVAEPLAAPAATAEPTEAPAADHPKPIALELEPLAVSAAFTDEQLDVLDMAFVASPPSATESAPPLTGGSKQPETPTIAEPPAETAGDLQEAEQPATVAMQEEPVVAPPAPLASELAAAPSGCASEPDLVMSVGPSAPMTEVLAMMPASEVAAELPSAAPVATDDRDRSVLLAAWETAVSRSEAEQDTSMPTPAPADPVPADAASVSIEARASSAPEVAMPPSLPESLPDKTASAELADFLLEPLPLPAIAGTATAGELDRETPEEAARDASDVMSEIEEELFAVLPMKAAVPGLSPQSPDAAQPAFAQAAAIPPSTAPAAPLAMAEVTQGADGAPQATTPIGTTTAVPARTAAKPMPRPAPNDPLAALKAMSDEERIALFT